MSNQTVLVAGALAGGILIGGAVGFVSHAVFRPPPPPEVVMPPPEVIEQQISEADLARLCETLTQDEKSRATEAQSKVTTLRGELDAKEAELAQLKSEKITDDKKRAAAQRRWKDMEAEIAGLKDKLVVAEKQRDEVREELRTTLRELDRQVSETQKYKEEAAVYKEKSTTNLWSSFQNGAKVEICDRGTRNRHEKCHEAVDAALTPALRERFNQCVNSGQATPALRQLEKKAAMPEHAVRLADDNKFTKSGWVIVFCDPTLPEAGGGAEDPP